MYEDIIYMHIIPIIMSTRQKADIRKIIFLHCFLAYKSHAQFVLSTEIN